MKVKELIELLKQVDPESVVTISSDPEGNTIKHVEEPLCESVGCDGYWQREVDLINVDDYKDLLDKEKEEFYKITTIYPR